MSVERPFLLDLLLDERAIDTRLRLGRRRARRPFGRCYELVWRYAVDRPPDVDFTIVHGAVIGNVGHAWVEIGGLVFDPCFQGFFRRADYYAATAARPVVAVARAEAAEALRHYRSYGPWHDLQVVHQAKISVSIR